MKNILDVVAYFTFPPLHGGQLRIHYFNKELSKYHKVTQLSFTPVIQFTKNIEHTPNYKEIIIWNPLFTLLVVWLKIFKKYSYDYIIPLAFRFYPSFLIQQYIKGVDVVQIEHPWLFSFVKRIKRLRQKKTILVEHNIEHELYQHIYADKKITSCIKKVEIDAVKKADVVFCVSKEDQKVLEKWNKDVVLVPHGIGEGQLKRYNLKRWPRKLVLFAGSNHPPNIEVVEFIKEKLAPKLAEYDFVVLGSVCPKSLRKGNLIITGPVSEIGKQKWLSRADMFINPVMSGSGSNVKMFEYVYFNKPIITTPHGARGILDLPIVFVTSLNKFAELIVKTIETKVQVQPVACEVTYSYIVDKILKIYD